MTTIYTLVEDYSGYESPFLAQHGVSFLIEHQGKCILFDVGQDALPVLYNMKKLELDPTSIDYIFLSHCHYDHTGGLLDVLKAIGKKVPVIAHPTIFRPHFIGDPPQNVGVPFRREEIQKYAQFLLTDEPIQIIKDVYSTGEITKREDFERAALDTLNVYTLKNGHPLKDMLSDDMSVVITTPEGLTIVTGCSHAGIISIINHTITLTEGKTEGKRIKAVIGGFHLIDASKERIAQTVKAFKEYHVNTVYTGHCTGLKAEAAFLETYRERFKKLHAGLVIEV